MTQPDVLRTEGMPSPAHPPAGRRFLLAAWGLLLVAVLAAGALRSSGRSSMASAISDARLARGRYLVTRTGWTAEDLSAVYAYLGTVPAVKNEVASAPRHPPAARR